MLEFRIGKLFQLLSVAMVFFMGHAHAAEAKGMLRVNTDQGTAVVYLGTDEIGNTPINRYMEPGSYTIRVLKDGFEPFVRKIQIRANQSTDVSARLFKGEGSVEVVVEPAGAILTLDGAEDVSTHDALRVVALFRDQAVDAGSVDLAGAHDQPQFR